RGALQSLVLPAPLSQQLNTLSRQQGVSLFMTLLAAFQVVLHYYTGRDDIIVGTDVANRNLAEIEELIGFFVNQLVLRTDLSGNPTFEELLERVREVALEAYLHQDLPFDKLVEALRPERSLSYSPLFQVKIVLQNAPEYDVELPGLRISYVEVDNGTSQLDLNVRVAEGP